jgi:hypothetical protein
MISKLSLFVFTLWMSLFNNNHVYATTTESPVTSTRPIEAHHSLHAPFDKSSMYWNYGGSTVITKDGIRLTPDTQDRRGKYYILR